MLFNWTDYRRHGSDNTIRDSVFCYVTLCLNKEWSLRRGLVIDTKYSRLFLKIHYSRHNSLLCCHLTPRQSTQTWGCQYFLNMCYYKWVWLNLKECTYRVLAQCCYVVPYVVSLRSEQEAVLDDLRFKLDHRDANKASYIVIFNNCFNMYRAVRCKSAITSYQLLITVYNSVIFQNVQHSMEQFVISGLTFTNMDMSSYFPHLILRKQI